MHVFCGISRRCLRWIGVALLCCALPAGADDVLRVGSKRFTESYVLGELIARTAQQAAGVRVEHKPGLGNTAILFAALKSGAIDVYPDYTGTIALELLGLSRVPVLEELNRQLAVHGLEAGVFLGFGNSYALAMRETQAAKRDIRRITDLKEFGAARLGLSPEFLNRKDGWPALRDTYDLDGLPVRGLEHGLAYEALAKGQVDVIDVYTTDPKISGYGLRVLEDDQRFFPEYEAVLVYRADLPRRHPAAWAQLSTLQGSITAADMMAMNAAVELQGRSFAAVAAERVQAKPGAPDAGAAPGLAAVLFGPDLGRLTREHLLLVCSSLLLSVMVGVPLGIWAQRAPRTGVWILALTGVLQTVPSLALLAFLIAVLDRIGAVPAILALFLYALLPVVRATETALAGVGNGMRDAGRALGFDSRQLMRLIELPLAMPGVLAGIKTAAVINVGTATVAAFVGAGGYGERIVAGLAVNDHKLLLAGAIPAALLALSLEWGFRWLDRRLLPRN
ncbi:MAG: ABC transporter permease subunit [Burkholderiales bacterium]|nr:ABC transporter permease subunit [Burkholderiales bacterium]